VDEKEKDEVKGRVVVILGKRTRKGKLELNAGN